MRILTLGTVVELQTQRRLHNLTCFCTGLTRTLGMYGHKCVRSPTSQYLTVPRYVSLFEFPAALNSSAFYCSRATCGEVLQGRFIHVPPREPTTDWNSDFGIPWWRDPKHVVRCSASLTLAIVFICMRHHHTPEGVENSLLHRQDLLVTIRAA